MLPDIYRSGDIERYLHFYAPNLTSYFDGKISSYEEACSFMRSLFLEGGRTIDFTTGDRTKITFSERSESATLCYPWREKFQFGNGDVSEIECYQSEVWNLRNGEWKIVHLHLTLLSENKG